MISLDDALIGAYRSWSETGIASVPDFVPADHDTADMQAKLAELDAVSDRCVICKTQASWLRRVTA